MAEWVDPRPKYPASGSPCVVQCDDGTLRFATFESTWDGPRWKDDRSGWWSMAHPSVIGWKHRWAASAEEVETADRFHDQFRPKEYRRYAK